MILNIQFRAAQVSITNVEFNDNSFIRDTKQPQTEHQKNQPQLSALQPIPASKFSRVSYYEQ
jgi:hypothetical protein